MYWYQFNVCGSDNKSPLGRTKTTPEEDDDVTEIGLAVYSCSNFPFGFFNAYGNAARKDSVDYVIHLGDYIYEYKNGDYGYGQSIGRVPLPDKEIFSLYDYRKRLATYRTDLDLLASHQTFPWVPVWDDHEVADNTYRDGSSELNNTEDSFIKDGGVSVDQRKMNAVRAYFEWMPIRQVEMDDNLRIWRSFKLGNLADLIMLDTRQYDRSITDLYWNTDYVHSIADDAGRSLMGSRQENWFYNQLSSSSKRGATWRIIGSQIVFSRVNQSIAFGDESPLNNDAWDGVSSFQYSASTRPPDRRRLLPPCSCTKADVEFHSTNPTEIGRSITCTTIKLVIMCSLQEILTHLGSRISYGSGRRATTLPLAKAQLVSSSLDQQ